jgi:hypothetical protein
MNRLGGGCWLKFLATTWQPDPDSIPTAETFGKRVGVGNGVRGAVVGGGVAGDVAGWRERRPAGDEEKVILDRCSVEQI